MNMQSPVTVEVKRRGTLPEGQSLGDILSAALANGTPNSVTELVQRIRGNLMSEADAISIATLFVNKRIESAESDREAYIFGSGDVVRRSDILPMMDELRSAFNRGAKIEAIKAHRSITRQGLKDSKDFIEGFSVFPTTYVASGAEKPETYLVMTKSEGDFGDVWRIRSSFRSQDYSASYNAVKRSQEFAEQLANDENEEVKLVKVLGETRSAFKMAD